ncbi:MAG: enoyl-CoA hydratase/isomerase family protein [Acidimicrobiales bacterium]|nr:enoyl-CoA hydratase/isomerase family protein [Acidimicrobiales bacterium]
MSTAGGNLPDLPPDAGEEIDVDDDPVLLEVKGGVAVLTLNRPDRHNAMGDAMDALLFRYLDLLRADRDVRVVVWRGNGDSFSAGRDVAELVGEVEGDDDSVGKARRHAHRHGFGASDFDVLDRGHWGARLLYDFPVPIVCALKGWTLGTSFERALLCDIRVAGESTKVGLPGMDHGLIPDSAGVAKLFEIGGSALALDLALTGRKVEADEALRLGLVSHVVPDDDLDEVVLDMARGIAERPPLVVRLLREQVQALAVEGVRGTLGRELVSQTLVLASHDFREQRLAREEDREPRYARR